MNIDKFGRINDTKSSHSTQIQREMDKLENMIILLKKEIIEIVDRLDTFSNLIIKEKPITKNSREQTIVQFALQ